MIVIMALAAGHIPAAGAKISIISRQYCRFYGRLKYIKCWADQLDRVDKRGNGTICNEILTYSSGNEANSPSFNVTGPSFWTPIYNKYSKSSTNEYEMYCVQLVDSDPRVTLIGIAKTQLQTNRQYRFRIMCEGFRANTPSTFIVRFSLVILYPIYCNGMQRGLD